VEDAQLRATEAASTTIIFMVVVVVAAAVVVYAFINTKLANVGQSIRILSSYKNDF